LKITDNGKGFDTARGYKGFGMTTLRQRAVESYIDFDLQSSIGNGTSVEMKIPII
jgi:signal transduction histidine kinase